MRPFVRPAPRSLRGRLTVWHGFVLSLALIGFTVAVYALLARSLWSELDRSLADRANQVNNVMRANLPSSPSFRRQVIAVPRPNTFASADTFVQVVALDGEVLGTSDNLGDVRLPVDAVDLTAVRAGRERYSLAQLEDEQVRLFSAPLLVQAQPVGVIQVARSLDRVEGTLGQLRLLAGAGLLIALGLSSLVVWLTAGTALRPLEHVIETAEAIGSSGDLARRVAAPPSDDEVGRLASTFNRMLDRLGASAGALRAAYARVESALEAQRRFVADASHELRTPLTTIRSNASLLCQFSDVTPEDRSAALAQISQEAERMTRLVQDLLTLARADAGQSLVQVPVALGPLVEDVAAQARVLSQGQHLLKTEVSDPGEVFGDRDALRQLTLILLDNAIKYTPPHGEITVRLDGGEGKVQLSVADTGIGMAPEDLPHVFERFYRADRGRKAGGTGLGLAIARWIVEQHGGTIQVASTPGRGSTFTVWLPRATKHAEFLPSSNLPLKSP